MASTYLLAIIVIAFLALTLGIIAYCYEKTREIIKAFALFLFNFFVGGVLFASVMSIQGGLMNVNFEFYLQFSFYFIGLMIFTGLLIETIWTFCAEMP